MRRNGVRLLRSSRAAGHLVALALLAALAAACGEDGSSPGSQGGDSGQDGEPETSETSETAGSAPVSDDCPAGTDSLTGYPPEGYGAVRSLTVCLYRADEQGTLRATWSAELGAEPAEKVVKAVALGRRSDCPAPAADDDQQVLLRVLSGNDFGSEPLWHDYLVRLDECASVVDLTESDLRGGPRVVDVSGRVLAPWVDAGLADQVDPDSLPQAWAPLLDQ